SVVMVLDVELDRTVGTNDGGHGRSSAVRGSRSRLYRRPSADSRIGPRIVRSAVNSFAPDPMRVEHRQRQWASRRSAAIVRTPKLREHEFTGKPARRPTRRRQFARGAVGGTYPAAPPGGPARRCIPCPFGAPAAARPAVLHTHSLTRSSLSVTSWPKRVPGRPKSRPNGRPRTVSERSSSP